VEQVVRLLVVHLVVEEVEQGVLELLFQEEQN
jgi:hypothetical protein